MKLDQTAESAPDTLTQDRSSRYSDSTDDSSNSDDQNDQDDDEQFEDALEKLANVHNTQPSMGPTSSSSSEPEVAPTSASCELKSQLQDTSQVLALALSNKFIEALDICGQK